MTREELEKRYEQANVVHNYERKIEDIDALLKKCDIREDRVLDHIEQIIRPDYYYEKRIKHGFLLRREFTEFVRVFPLGEYIAVRVVNRHLGKMFEELRELYSAEIRYILKQPIEGKI